MLLNKSDTVVMTNGFAEQKAFSVEMNSMLFRSVIDGIYADKLRSPFRELCTNAFDAHKDANKADVPFDVYLPSGFNPLFAVRDYGLSMSHEQIMGLYSTMFSSSKRDSNDAVGMIGLGSKSPFAYTNVFTIKTWRAGIKRIYSCFIGDDDVPQIALLSTSHSTEPEGTEVSFGVKPEDVARFREVTGEVLFGFEPKPRILNETYKWPTVTPLFKGDGWVVYNKAEVPFGSLMARQGCVLYPIDPVALGMANHPLFNWACVIDFPIGQLSVSTSREALGYDTTTKANVKQGIEDALVKMTSMVQGDIDKQSTWLDACHFVHKQVQNESTRQTYILLAPHLSWRGKAVRKNTVVEPEGTGYAMRFMDPNTVTMGVHKASMAFRKSPGTLAWAPDYFSNMRIYFEKEGLDKGASRMRRVVNDNTDRHPILWIKLYEGVDLPALQDFLLNAPMIDLATIQPLASGIVNTKVDRQMLRVVPGDKGHNHHGRIKPIYELVDMKPELYYVKCESYRFKSDDATITGQMDFYNLNQMIHYAKLEKIIPDDCKVYAVTKSKFDLISKFKMIDVLSLIAAETKKKAKTALFKNFSYNPYQGRASQMNDLDDALLLPLLKAWKDEVIKLSKDEDLPLGSVYLGALIDRFCRGDKKFAGGHNDQTLMGLERQIKQEYPLFLDVAYISSGGQTARVERKVKLNHYLGLLNK